MKITNNNLNVVDREEIDDILKKMEEKIKNGQTEAIPLEQFIKQQEEKREKYYNNLKFKDIRPYISKITRISICFKENKEYVNYRFISMVPNHFDDKYVYGIDNIEIDFRDFLTNTVSLKNCLEIVLSEALKEN